jgi:hypothetical protein
MSSMDPTKARRTRASQSETTQTAKKTRSRKTTAPLMVSSEQRRAMIAEHAYLKAERRGFLGDPVVDWLESEKEVDALLSGQTQ